MTTATATAAELLVDLEKIERALDRAYQPIADSLGVVGRDGVEKRVKQLKDRIKAVLIEEREAGRYEPAYDGELNVEAFLQDRSASPTYDTVSMVQKPSDAEALLEAARAGMVRIDHGMLEEFRKKAGAEWADMVAKFKGPGEGGTTALMVKRGAR